MQVIHEVYIYFDDLKEEVQDELISLYGEDFRMHYYYLRLDVQAFESGR